jgi:hypothetical protein
MSELSASDAWRSNAVHATGYGGAGSVGARSFSAGGDELGESDAGRLGFRLGEAVGLDIGNIGGMNIGCGGMEPTSHARELNGTGNTSAPGAWGVEDSPGAEEDSDGEFGGGGYWDDGMAALQGAQMQGQWGTAGEEGDPSDVYTDGSAGAVHK